MTEVHTSKRTISLAAIALIFMAIALILLASCTPSQEKLYEQCIRICVRANSNSELDRTVRLKVCSAVAAYLKISLADCKSKSEATNKLGADKDIILSLANATLRAEGVDYGAAIRFSNEYFSERSYDGRVFPGGKYDAVMIDLGSGNGEDNSGVAYPNPSFPTSEEQVVYRSWIKEMIDKLFN